jgi:hypothetical protein
MADDELAEHRAMADQIAVAAKTLNELLWDAAGAGLLVTVDIEDREHPDGDYPAPRVDVDVLLPLIAPELYEDE